MSFLVGRIGLEQLSLLGGPEGFEFLSREK